MNVRKVLIPVAIALVAGSASANTLWHHADNTIGYTEHPDHVAKSGVTRQQVLKEFEAVRKTPEWQALHAEGQADMAFTSTKSREEVKEELRVAMQDPAWRLMQTEGGWGNLPSNLALSPGEQAPRMSAIDGATVR